METNKFYIKLLADPNFEYSCKCIVSVDDRTMEFIDYDNNPLVAYDTVLSYIRSWLKVFDTDIDPTEFKVEFSGVDFRMLMSIYEEA